MYPHVNIVILSGRLTHDPEFRYLQTGSTVCTLRMAVNNRKFAGKGRKVNDPCFIIVEAWEVFADVVKKYNAQKGTPLMFTGKVFQERYLDPDGKRQQIQKYRVTDSLVVLQDTKPEPKPTAEDQPTEDPEEDIWNEEIPLQ